MEAGTTPSSKLRPVLAALGAALLGALLTLTWINALAAGKPAAPEPAGGGQYYELAKPDPGIGAVENPSYQDPTPEPTPTLTPRPPIVYTVAPVGGGVFTFTLGTASNNTYIFQVSATNGYTSSESVIVNFPLPDGITWTSANSGNWNCTSMSNARLIRCLYNRLGPTQLDLLYANVNVSIDATSPQTRTVSLEVNNLARNTVQVRTTIDSVDLGLQKTVSPTNALVDQTIEYTFTITNAGPAVPRGVYIIDNIPKSNLSFISPIVAPDNVTYNETLGRITFPQNFPFPRDDIGVTVRLRFRILDGANGRALVNNATVFSANTADWNPTNNSASATVVVGGLNITKSPAITSARAGQPFQLTIQVKNDTSNNFSNVQIQDVIQPGLEFVSAKIGDSNVGSYSSTSRTYNYYRGNFRSSDSDIELILTLRPSPDISASQTITNVATVNWGSGTSRVTLRSDEVEINAAPGGWLSVTKTSGLDEVLAGQNISYTVEVENVGSLNVDEITITDHFEQHLSPIRIIAGTVGRIGACPTASNPLACTYIINRLTPGQKATFRIAARVNAQAPDGSSIINRIVARGTDPNGSNPVDEFTEEVGIEAAPNYRISASKGVSPSQAQVNESFNFRIRVTNEGDVTIPAVRVTDEFEPVLDLTSVTTNRGTATMNTGAKTIDVNVGDLAPGQEVRIDVVARVNTTVTKVETYDNRAKVTFSGGDIRSNTIRYRVLPGATLPGTGLDLAPPPAPADPPAAPPAEEPHPLAGASLAMLGLGLLGMMAAMLLLAFGLFAWIRKPLKAGGTIRLSLVLAAISAGLLVGGWALAGSLPEPPDQAGILIGAKPPLATRLAATQTAAEVPAVASGETSETEAPSLPLSLPTDTPAAVETQPPLFEPTPTLRALPDYPIPSPTAMVAQGPGGIPPDSSAITRLVIPSINLDTVVKYVPFDGRTWLIGGLRQEVAWMGDTSWPGLGGNTGLAGHVDLADGSAGPFADLKNLRAGDQIQVFTEKNRFNYTVRAQSVVDDHDLTVIAATAGPQLTLITCTGMDPALGVYLARLIVFADLANVQPLTAAGN